MLNNIEINYKLSLYPSKFLGYQSKNKNKGNLTFYISTIWKWINPHYRKENEINNTMINKFIKGLLEIILLERICIERAFQKIRMKNRCKNFKGFTCKIDYIYSMFKD